MGMPHYAPDKPSEPSFSWRVLVTGLVLIAASASLQCMGFCFSLEQHLKQLLPAGFLPKTPQTVLITLERDSSGFRALDVAMVLRGLSQFQPGSVGILGSIGREETPVPLLAGLLARLSSAKDHPIPVVMPREPSPDSLFTPVSLRSFPPMEASAAASRSEWPVLMGVASDKEEATSFMPLEATPGNGIPLFATLSGGSVIASFWWDLLTLKMDGKESNLLFGKVLSLPNGSTLRITASGEAEAMIREHVRSIPLDDFLLHIEKKERGTISPEFEGYWGSACVILGTVNDLRHASVFSSILEHVSYSRPSWVIQSLIVIAWMGCVLLFWGFPWRGRCLCAAGLLLGVILATCSSLHLGIIIPFVPGILSSLLLAIPDQSELREAIR